MLPAAEGGVRGLPPGISAPPPGAATQIPSHAAPLHGTDATGGSRAKGPPSPPGDAKAPHPAIAVATTADNTKYMLFIDDLDSERASHVHDEP